MVHNSSSTIVYDTLVRAGAKCVSALVGDSGDVAVCSRGVRIVPDTLFTTLADPVRSPPCNPVYAL